MLKKSLQPDSPHDYLLTPNLGEIIMEGLKIETLEEMREGRRACVRQIKKLKALVESYDNLIEHYSGGTQLNLEEIAEKAKPLNRDVGPTDYVRALFETEPSKRWKSLEVVAALKVSSVEMSHNNIQANVASILKRLVDQEEIEKHGKQRKRWYKKKERVVPEKEKAKPGVEDDLW